MHWVALYLASSIKSSASKAPSPYRSHSACIPETPLLGAEVTVHGPCQVAEACQGLRRTPFFTESGADDRPDADPDGPVGNERCLRKGSPSPQTGSPPG